MVRARQNPVGAIGQADRPTRIALAHPGMGGTSASHKTIVAEGYEKNGKEKNLLPT